MRKVKQVKILTNKDVRYLTYTPYCFIKSKLVTKVVIYT